MKSIFLTFLIFAGVFIFAGSGVLSVIGEDWFHYVSYIAFVAVMLIAVYVTLIKKTSEQTDNSSENSENEISQIKIKGDEHE